MSRLVRLYPRSWRARYEAEFLALLEDRPTRMVDRLDVIRGALDARLHSQLREDSSGPRPWGLSGLATALGGLLFILGGLSWTQPGADYDTASQGPDGIYAFVSVLFGPAAILSFVGLLALRRRLPRPGRKLASVGLVVAGLGLAILIEGNVNGGWLHLRYWWWSAWYIAGVPAIPIGVGLLMMAPSAIGATALGVGRALPLALGLLVLMGLILAGDGYARDYAFLAIWSMFGLGWVALGWVLASVPRQRLPTGPAT